MAGGVASLGGEDVILQRFTGLGVGLEWSLQAFAAGKEPPGVLLRDALGFVGSGQSIEQQAVFLGRAP